MNVNVMYHSNENSRGQILINCSCSLFLSKLMEISDKTFFFLNIFLYVFFSTSHACYSCFKGVKPNKYCMSKKSCPNIYNNHCIKLIKISWAYNNHTLNQLIFDADAYMPKKCLQLDLI